MNKIRGSGKVTGVALAVLAIVLAVIAPGPAWARDGGHGGGFEGHHGFEGHRDFDRRSHGGVFIGVPFGWAPVYPDYYPPAYTYAPSAPTYWYYCPSYGAYYPTAPSCPEAWVPVPAQ